MSREVDPQNIQSTDDFLYLAQRGLLPQEWVDANGGDEGVAEIMRGEAKPKKPKAKAATKTEATPEEEMEEESDEEEETQATPAKRTR